MGSIDPERGLGQRVLGVEEVGEDVLLGNAKIGIWGSNDHVGGSLLRDGLSSNQKDGRSGIMRRGGGTV